MKEKYVRKAKEKLIRKNSNPPTAEEIRKLAKKLSEEDSGS